MHNQKMSISLPISLYKFVNQYRTSYSCKTRSEVFQEALKLLQKKELEQCYREAAQEMDSDFEITASDGLDDETW